MSDIAIPAGAKALVFDCDGTLVFSHPLYLTGWREAFSRHAETELEPDWFMQRGGLSESLLLDAFEEEHGRKVDREAVARTMRGHVLSRIGELKENGPVVGLVRRYYGELPLAVASSGSREVVEASLRQAGVLPLFDAVVTVEDIEHPKPAPDIYLAAAKKLGVAPAECVVLEDSAQGMEAARRAGMTVIDVRPVSEPPE